MNDQKIDLGGVTFVIHYRKDSEDRFFNLKTVLRYYQTFFTHFELIVIQDDSKPSNELGKLIDYHKFLHENQIFKVYLMTNDGNFKKNSAYNMGVEKAKYDKLGFVDTDALIHPKHMLRAVKALDGECDHIYPYNGYFVHIKKHYFTEFLDGFKFDDALEKLENRNLYWESDYLKVEHNKSKGGMFLMTKNAWENMGGFCEKFSGWGYEDDHTYELSRKKLNKIGFLTNKDCILWHLEHFAIRNENPDIFNNASIVAKL